MNSSSNRFFVLALLAVVLLAVGVVNSIIVHTWQPFGGSAAALRMNSYTGEVQALADHKWVSFSGAPVLNLDRP
jgi:hypothetical protein